MIKSSLKDLILKVIRKIKHSNFQVAQLLAVSTISFFTTSNLRAIQPWPKCISKMFGLAKHWHKLNEKKQNKSRAIMKPKNSTPMFLLCKTSHSASQLQN